MFTKIGPETSYIACRILGKIIIQNPEAISFQYISHTLVVLVIAHHCSSYPTQQPTKSDLYSRCGSLISHLEVIYVII